MSHAARGPLAALLAGLLVGLAGCGGSGTYPVSGRLEYEDGTPATELAGETIVFSSEAIGMSATGMIEPDGTFRLGTTRPNDGAFPALYKVTLSQPHPDPERGVFDQRVIDIMYEDLDRTPLEAIVEPKSNEFTFKLKRIAAKAKRR